MRFLCHLCNPSTAGIALAGHDDVIKWKHFPRYWPFVRGIHRSPVNSPHKGQWRGALVFSLICAWIKGWVNNLQAGDLRRHRAHHDVIIMGLYMALTATSHNFGRGSMGIIDFEYAFTVWWRYSKWRAKFRWLSWHIKLSPEICGDNFEILNPEHMSWIMGRFFWNCAQVNATGHLWP